MTTTAEIITIVPPASGSTSQATGINQYGIVVGFEDNSTGASQGFLAANGATTLLSPSPSYAGAINGYDYVVGWSGSNYSAEQWAYGLIASTVLPGGMDGSGNAVNSSGAIGGEGFTNGSFQAFVSINGTTSWLGALDNATITGTQLSRVNGLNDSNVAVGSSLYKSGSINTHAFSWQNGTLTDLGTLAGGSNSDATAINKAGQIVGYSDSTILWDHAVLWQNGTITDLGGLPGYVASLAFALNDNGQIVGYSTDGSGVQHAVLWQNGAVTDLNSLLPTNSHWVLQDATGINNNGLIVGYGLYNGIQTGFEMTLNGLTTPLHTAQAVLQLFQSGQTLAQQAVIDSASDISANLDALQALAAAGDLGSINLSDSGTPTLKVTPSQIANDAPALAKIVGSYALQIDASAANLIFTAPSGTATTVLFSDALSDYQVTPLATGAGFTVSDINTGRTSSDTLYKVSSLIFSDGSAVYEGSNGPVILQDVGSLPAGAIHPFSIDSKGDIAGFAGSSSAPTTTTAFFWSQGTVTSLQPLAGAAGVEADQVTASGLIVGESYATNSVGGSSTAVYWPVSAVEQGNTKPTAIGWLSGDFASLAYAANDEGQIVGSSYNSGTSYHGFLWQAGSMISLGSLGGSQVAPEAINDAGLVVGKASLSNGNFHAFSWQSGVLTDLGTLSGDTSSGAASVNMSGTIVGYADNGSSPYQAVYWSNGQIHQLPNRPGLTSSFVNGINDQGWMVGEESGISGAAATLWANGTVYNLNSFLPSNSSWRLGDAMSINDAGQISGVGSYNGVQTAFELSLPSTLTINAAAASTDQSSGLVYGPIAIADSALDVSLYLGGLQTLAAAGNLGSIALTDSGTPSLSITAAQLLADGSVLNDISSAYSLIVSAGATSVSIAGPAGHATTVSFSSDASQYTVTAANGVITVSGGGVSDQLTDVAAIQFADFTEIVAATPAAANVTSGNITELYSAVLGREPDVGGLTFYQTYLQKNPSTPLLNFAEFFLTSSEYTSAHNYAQTSAGDMQFIQDSYQNLLHRTPSSDEVNFYLANVMTKAVANLTPGTTAYVNAEFQAHAQMLVYFSSSAEFLADVQITAQNPASAKHWLILT